MKQLLKKAKKAIHGNQKDQQKAVSAYKKESQETLLHSNFFRYAVWLRYRKERKKDKMLHLLTRYGIY